MLKGKKFHRERGKCRDDKVAGHTCVTCEAPIDGRASRRLKNRDLHFARHTMISRVEFFTRAYLIEIQPWRTSGIPLRRLGNYNLGFRRLYVARI